MRRVAWLLVGALSACDRSTTEPGPGEAASIEIVAADSVVAVGAELALAAVVRDAEGRTLPDAEASWLSIDSTTAAVATDGALTGRAIGYAAIVATSAGLADTMLVRVRYDEIPDDVVRVRFVEEDVEADLRGFLRFNDTMGGAARDEAGLVGGPNGPGRDTVLTVILPGTLTSGRFAVTPFPLDGGPRPGPVALLRFGRAESGDLEYFASVGAGWIVLDIEEPPAPGWRFGSASGFLHLPLVRLAPNPGGPPILTGDTVLLHANLRVDLQTVLFGSVVVTLEGGPLEGTSVLSSVRADEDDHGGWFYVWDADFDGLGSGPERWEMGQELRVVGPAVGVYEMPRFLPEQFDEPSLWPDRFSSIFLRDDPRLALITGGTLRVDRYVPPTLEDYGQMDGSLEGRFELWSDSVTSSGDTIDALAAFHVAIPPFAGLPGVAEARLVESWATGP